MIYATGLVPQRADFAYTQDPALVGKIHWTQPAAGDTVNPGSTVWYIEYRPQVANVVGKPVSEGMQMIQSLGYAPQRADLWPTQDPNLVGTIAQTQPAASQNLESGATVWYIEYKAE